MTHQGASVFVAGLKVKYFSTHHKSVPNNLFEAFRMVSGVVLQLVFKQCSNLQFYLWLCSTLQQMRLPYSFFEPWQALDLWVSPFWSFCFIRALYVQYVSIRAMLFISFHMVQCKPCSAPQNVEVALSITALLLVQKTSAAATVLANVAPKLHRRGFLKILKCFLFCSCFIWNMLECLSTLQLF